MASNIKVYDPEGDMTFILTTKPPRPDPERKTWGLFGGVQFQPTSSVKTRSSLFSAPVSSVPVLSAGTTVSTGDIFGSRQRSSPASTVATSSTAPATSTSLFEGLGGSLPASTAVPSETAPITSTSLFGGVRGGPTFSNVPSLSSTSQRQSSIFGGGGLVGSNDSGLFSASANRLDESTTTNHSIPPVTSSVRIVSWLQFW